MGSDDGFLGINGCILTYSPQIFRYSFDGQVIHDDFCVTQVKSEPGTSVNFYFQLINVLILKVTF